MITRDELSVIDTLRSYGIHADKIPEGLERSPDIAAHDLSHRYLIEVKTRTDDDMIAEELQRTRSVFIVSPIAPRKAITGIFQHAMSQLGRRNTTELRVVWVCIRSQHDMEHTLASQVEHSVYGIVRISGSGKADQIPKCYYFRDSIFFRYKDLDGVVIDSKYGRQLCLNSYSAYFVELRASQLGSAFAQNVVDPVELERSGECLIADCLLDRKQTELVLSYVASKYNIAHATISTVNAHTGFVLPRPESR